MIVDGNPMRIAGRTGKSLIFAPARQLYFDAPTNAYLKKVINLHQKLSINKNYVINETRDNVSKEMNLELYEKIVQNIQVFKTMPVLGNNVVKFGDESKIRFANATINVQCEIINSILLAFGCNTSSANLNTILTAAIAVGKCLVSNDITDHPEVRLIQESPTGLFVKVMDLLSLEAKS